MITLMKSLTLQTHYIPTEFALDMINFIKLVNGGKGEENKSPVAHLKLLDSFVKKGDVTNLCHRGFAKTTLIEYLIEYIGVYCYIYAICIRLYG